jgi:hypothetical protein
MVGPDDVDDEGIDVDDVKMMEVRQGDQSGIETTRGSQDQSGIETRGSQDK